MNKQNPTWDLSPLFPTFTSWKQALKKELSISYDQLFSDFKNKKTLSCNGLKSLLDLYFKKEREIKKLYTWAHLFFDQETSMVDGREAYSSSLFCLQKFKEATSWIEPSIIQQNEKQFTRFLSSSHLAQYKVYLSNLKRVKKHTLSFEEEALMAMSGKTAPTTYKAFSALNDTDLSFPEALDKNKKNIQSRMGPFSNYCDLQIER